VNRDLILVGRSGDLALIHGREATVATTRERIQQLLKTIPDERLRDAEAALEYLSDPVLLACLNAPEDDEPTTAEDLEALAETREAYRRGETISHEDVKREMGW